MLHTKLYHLRIVAHKWEPELQPNTYLEKLAGGSQVHSGCMIVGLLALLLLLLIYHRSAYERRYFNMIFC